LSSMAGEADDEEQFRIKKLLNAGNARHYDLRYCMASDTTIILLNPANSMVISTHIRFTDIEESTIGSYCEGVFKSCGSTIIVI